MNKGKKERQMERKKGRRKEERKAGEEAKSNVDSVFKKAM